MDAGGRRFDDSKLKNKITLYEAGLMELNQMIDLRDHLIQYVANLNQRLIMPCDELINQSSVTQGGDY